MKKIKFREKEEKQVKSSVQEEKGAGKAKGGERTECEKLEKGGKKADYLPEREKSATDDKGGEGDQDISAETYPVSATRGVDVIKDNVLLQPDDALLGDTSAHESEATESSDASEDVVNPDRKEGLELRERERCVCGRSFRR